MLRLNIYKSPTEWESFYISKEEWPEVKEWLDKKGIKWYTLVLGEHDGD
tara:strand:+ start:561 stop:707 length:147 start_codon:yes stop_codon:yes gene_type:complete